MNYEHKYKVRWKYEVGEWTREELEKDGTWHAGDAILVSSNIYPPDGSLSTLFTPVDGRDSEEVLSDNELFKIWSLLSIRLGKSETLPEHKKMLCNVTVDSVKTLLGLKGEHVNMKDGK